MRTAIPDSSVRPFVMVLFDPTSDRGSPFLQAPILLCPDFHFFQAAMEPFDVAVAFRGMIRRSPREDPVQQFRSAPDGSASSTTLTTDRTCLREMT